MSSDMENIIADLAQMQIQTFFEANDHISQQECNEEAARLSGGVVQPTKVQGASSYTVTATTDGKSSAVVQFRLADSPLPMAMLHLVEQSYRGFTPHHCDMGKFKGLPVFTMTDIGGVSMYLARPQLHKSSCHLLHETLKDYARFFASAWHNLVDQLIETRISLWEKYSSQLRELQAGLPSRFRPTLDVLLSQLDGLFTEDWPLVPNHVDLLENNIHVDQNTGKLTGVCDWRDTEIGPFGLSLGGLETMLGVARSPTLWEYHANEPELRELFWQTFYASIGNVTPQWRDRIQIARNVGLCLQHGFAWHDDGVRVPAPDGEEELPYLEAVMLRLGDRAVSPVRNSLVQ